VHYAGQPSTSRGRDKHVIAILIAPDSVALEVALLQQYFGGFRSVLADLAGSEESPYEVVLCGEAPEQRLASGADFGVLAPLDVMLQADSVMIPGLEMPFAPRSERLLSAVRDAHVGGARMISYCGGAFVLGLAGLLDGRRATTHWLVAAEFREMFPLATLDADQLYVEDGGVHTSGGMLAAADLASHIVALDLGQKYANDLARVLVSSPHRPGGQAQFIKASLRAHRADDDVFLDWIRENLHEPLSLERLARHQHTSKRTLVRNFRRRMGMSVLDWINRERVDLAKTLLETTDLRVSEIAAMVGFGSNESLRRNFEKIVGRSAYAYRSVFQPSASADPAVRDSTA